MRLGELLLLGKLHSFKIRPQTYEQHDNDGNDQHGEVEGLIVEGRSEVIPEN